MIYKAVEVIWIFFADGRTDGLTEVFEEVLSDLKKVLLGLHLKEGNSISDIFLCSKTQFFCLLINVHLFVNGHSLFISREGLILTTVSQGRIF